MSIRSLLLFCTLVLFLINIWIRSDRAHAHEGVPHEISSIFVSMKTQSVPIPREGRSATGGGITSIGSSIVLLTPDGRVFLAKSNGSVARSRITPPENGYEDYEAASKRAPYDKYEHNPGWFRYFDIKYFDNQAGTGLLVSYLKYHKDRACYTTSIARAMIPGKLSAEKISIGAKDWIPVYETKPCLPLKKEFRAIEGHMGGGRMVVDDARGRILLANGDYAWDGMYGPRSLDPDNPLALSQDPKADYGKVLGIDILSGKAETITRGHRNIQGITIDDKGSIWTVEHGPRGGDELNQIQPGRNFGWPLETYGTKYNALPVSGVTTLGRHETYDEPAFAWLPSIATSGLTTIRKFHEAWAGDLLASTLKEGNLVRVRVVDGSVVFAEQIKIGRRIRQVHEHTDGTIVLWLDDDSQLLLLKPVEGNLGAKFVEAYVEKTLDVSSDVKSSVRTAVDDCSQCHSFTAGTHNGAPSLAEIYGSRVGSTSYPHYSSAMKGSGDVWTPERLDAFLKNTKGVYPATTMPSMNIEDPKVRAGLIDILRALRQSQE